LRKGARLQVVGDRILRQGSDAASSQAEVSEEETKLWLGEEKNLVPGTGVGRQAYVGAVLALPAGVP